MLRLWNRGSRSIHGKSQFVRLLTTSEDPNPPKAKKVKKPRAEKKTATKVSVTLKDLIKEWETKSIAEFPHVGGLPKRALEGLFRNVFEVVDSNVKENKTVRIPNFGIFSLGVTGGREGEIVDVQALKKGVIDPPKIKYHTAPAHYIKFKAPRSKGGKNEETHEVKKDEKHADKK